MLESVTRLELLEHRPVIVVHLLTDALIADFAATAADNVAFPVRSNAWLVAAAGIVWKPGLQYSGSLSICHSWISSEVDVVSYFDSVNWEWLRKFVRHRVKDGGSHPTPEQMAESRRDGRGRTAASKPASTHRLCTCSIVRPVEIEASAVAAVPPRPGRFSAGCARARRGCGPIPVFPAAPLGVWAERTDQGPITSGQKSPNVIGSPSVLDE